MSELEINKEQNDFDKFKDEGELDDDFGSEPGGSEPEQNGEVEEVQPPTYTPEEEKERQFLIMKIRAYIAKFPKHFSGIDHRMFQFYSPAQLERTLDEFRYAISMKSSGTATSLAVQGGIRTIESIATTFTPLKLEGLAATCEKSEEIQDILKELSIEYIQYEPSSPETRLLLAIAKAAVLTHTLNTARADEVRIAEAAKLAREASKELIEKSKDL